MGFFDRFRGKGPDGYRANGARKLELAGDLEAAVRAFLDAGLPDEGARVLLLRADAEVALERRLSFCAQASAMATDVSIKRSALKRKAMMRFDIVRSQSNIMKSEVLLCAKELEDAEAFEAAAEAYALVSDNEGEVRMLTSAGSIDKLEDKLRESHASARSDQDMRLGIARIQDLDKGGERREALRIGAEILAKSPDERVEDLLRVIRGRLLRGPTCDLKIGSVSRRYVLGNEVIIGRGDASITVESRALSRDHLRIGRNDSGFYVEDLGTKNGTFVAGARISGRLPVGQGITMKLGGDVACVVRPSEVMPARDGVPGGIEIDVAGERRFASLGALVVGAWRVALEGEGGNEASFVTLESSTSAPAFLGVLQLAGRIELCAGDAVCDERGGTPTLMAFGASR